MLCSGSDYPVSSINRRHDLLILSLILILLRALTMSDFDTDGEARRLQDDHISKGVEV